MTILCCRNVNIIRYKEKHNFKVVNGTFFVICLTSDNGFLHLHKTFAVSFTLLL